MIKKLRHALLCALLLAMTLLGSLAAPQPTAAQSTTTYFVTHVDSSQFPDVTFTLRALDINNNTLTNLNNTSFTVYENGQAVPAITVTPHADAPVAIVFVIDLGHFSNYLSFGFDNLRQAISTLVTTNGLFVEGKDTVQVLGRQNVNGDQTVELRHATTASADLTNWLNAFTFPRSQANTKGLLGVTDGLKAMSVLVPVPGTQPGAIVFITRYIEDPTKTTATTAAQELGTRGPQPVRADRGAADRHDQRRAAARPGGQFQWHLCGAEPEQRPQRRHHRLSDHQRPARLLHRHLPQPGRRLGRTPNYD